ncbi:MAG: mechanosensitive ion channel family protein [Nanoarchaeota archaeon]|nr:mechanosensitive ion channel family protein [Nanoarchaeota archaeon]
MEFIRNYLLNLGLSSEIVSFVMLLLLLILIFVVKIIVDKIIIDILKSIVGRGKSIGKFILQRKVIYRVSHIVPALVILFFTSSFPEYEGAIFIGLNIYFTLIGLFIIFSILDVLEDIYNTKVISKDKPIRGFIQVSKIIFSIASIITIISSLIGQSPIYILSGLGAATAILLIVFKDSLLGLVAGIQISTNDMLRIGDWIEMPKYGADGDVIEISLNTVKVKNWDMTITTIPAYALISDSFKNWRGMSESGGRRIMREILIDINSVSFVSPQLLEKMKKVQVLKNFIHEKEKEIDSYNKKNNIDTTLSINGRRLTNLGIFRAYIYHYLENNSHIHNDMIKMVRQMPSNSKGVPLQVYAFTNDIKWVNFESVQSDIFDHLFAVISEFDLRVYQEPTGHDFKQFFDKNNVNNK